MKNNIYYLVFVSLFLLMSYDHNESINFNSSETLRCYLSADPLMLYDDYAYCRLLLGCLQPKCDFFTFRIIFRFFDCFQQEQDFVSPMKI